ncbi:sulfite exporter TauE/SafE family protein [Amaricoccus sp.]|uniref:sulfite exporter TauE/SafE family protein n=1 Tax=Amaricoccus sp. TaxID=1872485 RepID=UPI001B7A2F27|nr:sulfite exporter TauE/SafE family protein [Amaricoccus sp.]MBP7002089.1 sulfite exporter TauE/SafE family protein [Amaricoccus sp.]
MQIYLPIAEISVNALLLLGIGGMVGVLSGLFGVGGGFILTPLLFFLGIPPAVAVASAANQIAGSSFSALLVHLQRRTVDVKMGCVLLAGGLIGSALGVELLVMLHRYGQFELVVSLLYVVLLGTIGVLMLIESARAIRRRNDPNALLIPRKRHTWAHGLPVKMRFRTSQLYVSAIPPFVIGAAVGVLAAMMGVGGGFIMVPAMIYLIGMPTKVVIGTSLFQFLFVTAFTTILQAVQNHSVDVVLTVLLLVGGVIGAQVGASLSGRLRAEQLRILLAVLVILVGFRLLLDLVIRPEELYSISVRR